MSSAIPVDPVSGEVRSTRPQWGPGALFDGTQYWVRYQDLPSPGRYRQVFRRLATDLSSIDPLPVPLDPDGGLTYYGTESVDSSGVQYAWLRDLSATDQVMTARYQSTGVPLEGPNSIAAPPVVVLPPIRLVGGADRSILTYAASGNSVRAIRLVSGVPLDPPLGFSVAPSTGIPRETALAWNGQRALFVSANQTGLTVTTIDTAGGTVAQPVRVGATHSPSAASIDGGFLVAWVEGQQPMTQTLSSAGTPTNTLRLGAVAGPITASSTFAFGTQYWVSWVQNVDGGRLWTEQLDERGALLAGPVLVSDRPVDEPGTWLFGATPTLISSDVPGPDRDIWARRFTPGLLPIDVVARAVSTTAIAQTLPSLRRSVVYFSDNRGDTFRLRSRALDGTGRPTGTRQAFGAGLLTAVVSTATGSDTHELLVYDNNGQLGLDLRFGAVARASVLPYGSSSLSSAACDGRFAVGLCLAGLPAVVRLNEDAVDLEPATALEPDGGGTPCRAPALTCLNGRYLAVWSSGADLFARVLEPQSLARGSISPVVVEPGEQVEPSVAAFDGGAVVVYLDRSDAGAALRGAVMNETGTVSSFPIPSNPQSVGPPKVIDDPQQQGFVVVSGSAQVSLFRFSYDAGVVAQYSLGVGSNAVVAMLRENVFLVASTLSQPSGASTVQIQTLGLSGTGEPCMVHDDCEFDRCVLRRCTPFSNDGGSSDSGVADAGATDAGATDAGVTDAGVTDAGATDAGVADAGVTDAGVTDAGVADAGATDAGVTDAGVDAGETDAGVPDSDAGISDAGLASGSADAGDSGFIEPDAGLQASDAGAPTPGSYAVGCSALPGPAALGLLILFRSRKRNGRAPKKERGRE